MTLQQQLDGDFKNALKTKGAEYPTLTLIRAAIKQVEVDTNKILTDTDIIAILKKEAKKRNEAITAYSQGGRPELAAKETMELNIIQKYLPPAMTEEEIQNIVKEVISAHPDNANNVGKITGLVMTKLKGQADGATVQKLIKELMAK